MPIQLRISDNDPYVYLEPTAGGSVAIGTDDLDSNKLKIVMSDAQSNLDPGSGTIALGTCSLSIDPTVNGNIEFCPKGLGQSTFARGNVEIQGTTTDGNLLMPLTATGGAKGVIEVNGFRFMHSYGSNNTFLGSFAGNTSVPLLAGANNVGIGTSALVSATAASNNTAVGFDACVQLTTGDSNTAIGSAAMFAITTGSKNTAIGNIALDSLTTGTDNISIGWNSGGYTTSESSNIVIGSVGTIGDNNKIRIGTQGASAGQQNTCFIAGIVGASVTPTGVVGANALGQLGNSNGGSGQVLVGGGAGPVWANITSTDGSITVTNGANTLNVATTAQPGITWSEVTGTSQAAAANAGYVANNAGLVTVTLIAAASAGIGTKLRVTGINNATGWKIAQNASQQIFFNALSSTAGVTGFIASTATRDSVELVCVSANGLFWNVISSVGNITVS